MNETITKKRGVLLTIWLILMLIVNTGIALFYLLGGLNDYILKAFLALTVPWWAIITLGSLALLNVICAVFLLMWKKWAFFAICGSCGVALIANIIIGINTFQVILSSFLYPAILYLIMRSKWNLFE